MHNSGMVNYKSRAPKIPIYQLIKDVIREEVRQKKYQSGDKLPSVNQLARQFNTSRNTAIKAINDLCRDGLLESLQGVGTIVRRQQEALMPIQRTGLKKK